MRERETESIVEGTCELKKMRNAKRNKKKGDTGKYKMF